MYCFFFFFFFFFLETVIKTEIFELETIDFVTLKMFLIFVLMFVKNVLMQSVLNSLKNYYTFKVFTSL